MTNRKTALNLLTLLVSEPANVEQVHKYWDKLTAYMLENFPGPSYDNDELYSKEKEDVHLLLTTSNQDLVKNLLDQPSTYSDIVFPLAISKLVLNNPRINLQSSKLTNFDGYFKRYSKILTENINQPN